MGESPPRLSSCGRQALTEAKMEMRWTVYLQRHGTPDLVSLATFRRPLENATAGQRDAFVRERGVDDRMIFRARIFGRECEWFGQFIGSPADEDGEVAGAIEFAGFVTGGGKGGERAVGFACVRSRQSAGPFIVAVARNKKRISVWSGMDAKSKQENTERTERCG